MLFILRKYKMWFVMIPVVSLALAGCAMLPLQPPEDQLRSRVTEYLEAKMNGNLAEMYKFQDSSFKKNIAKEQFLARKGNTTFKDYKIESIEMAPSEDEATVKVTYTIEFQGFTFENAPQTQTWVKERWQWYLKESPRKRVNPME